MLLAVSTYLSFSLDVYIIKINVKKGVDVPLNTDLERALST